jgi:hypothetical protein
MAVPTKRRKRSARPIGISPEAVAAWRAGDFDGLACALGIRPWQRHPWPRRLTALGVDSRRPPAETLTPFDQSWQRAVDLQAALLELAGPAPERLR